MRARSWPGAAESAESWSHVFHELTERGLRGVTYVVSDEHVGLVQSVRRYFPDAVHQRCQVHYLRNALSKVSNDALQHELTRGLADAWAAPTQEEAARRLRALAVFLASR
jgi:putative transposase